jgi:hypothetical protein
LRLGLVGKVTELGRRQVGPPNSPSEKLLTRVADHLHVRVIRFEDVAVDVGNVDADDP